MGNLLVTYETGKTTGVAALAACVTVLAAALHSSAAEDSGCFRLADATVVYEKALLSAPKNVWGADALNDLTNVLSLTTGASIRAVPESAAVKDGRPVIYLGDTAAARAAGLDTASLVPNEFRMKVVPGAAYLAGRSGAGSAFAVTEFLKRFCDYRFLTANGDDPYTVDPSRVARACDIRKKSAFSDVFNGTHGFHGRFDETLDERKRWTRRLRGGYRIPEHGSRYTWSELPGRCHSQFRYCPIAKYADKHPEYYSMDAKGRRVRPAGDHAGSQLCFSNPDVYRICRDSLFRFVAAEVAKDPVNYPRIYDFSQQDNSASLCKCPGCREIIAKYDRKGGFKDGGDAGLQLEFVNRLARDVREKYPEVMIRTFAYVSTEQPPRGIVPEDNVIIWFCDLYSICNHQLPLTHPFNRKRLELFNAWRPLAKHVQVWDYVLWGGASPGTSSDCLQVYPDACAADARFLRDLGTEYLYIENHFANQPLWEFNSFMQLELCFDPEQDVDELIDAYCRVYGKAAGDMRKMIEFLRRTILENPPKSAYHWHSRILPWRNAEVFERILGYTMSAYAAAQTHRAKSRIAAIAAGAIQELILQYRFRPEKSARLAGLVRDYPRLAAEGRAIGLIKGPSLELARKVDEEFVELATLRFKDLPEELENVPEEELLYFAYQTAPPGRAGKVVDDPKSECGKAVRWDAAKTRPGARPPFDAMLIQSDGFPVLRFTFTPPEDGSYGWTKIGKVHLGPNAKIRLFNCFNWNLASAYTVSDGAEVDPNWFEAWISSRLAGAADSADEKSGLFCDRVLLRRVKPADAQVEK